MIVARRRPAGLTDRKHDGSQPGRPSRPLFYVCLVLAWGCSPPADLSHDTDPDVGPDGEAGDGDADTDTDLDGDTTEPWCRGNQDAVIEAGEAPVVVGASLVYLVNAEGSHPAVEIEGTMVGGARLWDFATELPGDRRVEEEVLDPSRHWFGEHFPEATYASIVAGFEGAVGVYRATEEGIALLGLASVADESTLITYDTPVFMIRFPLSVGDTWTVEARATGQVDWIAFNGIEHYTVTADAAGEVRVPGGTYPVVRVRTEMERSNAGPLADHRISYAWIAECWGRVAYVGSLSGERDPSFDVAEQYWRLALR